MYLDHLKNLLYKNRSILYFLIALSLLLYIDKVETEYKWSLLYFNYDHGFLKRGLMGEIFNILSIPHGLDGFKVFSLLLLVGIIVGYYHLIKNKSPLEFLSFSLIFVCSPLLLKNLIYDWGRFDQIALLFVFLLLLNIKNKKQALTILYASPILLFMHEGTILWAFPLLLTYAYFEYRSSLFVLVPLLICCGGIILLWGGLDVDSSQYEQQLHEWAAPVKVYGVVINSITSNVETSMQEAVTKLPKTLSSAHGIKGIALLISMIAPLLFIRSRMLLLFAGLTIAASSILYFVAVDHYRWMSLQGICCLCLLLFAYKSDLIRHKKLLCYYLILLSSIVLVLSPIGIWR